MKKQDICINVAECTPEQRKEIVTILKGAGEHVYADYVYELTEFKFDPSYKFLVFNEEDNDWVLFLKRGKLLTFDEFKAFFQGDHEYVLKELAEESVSEVTENSADYLLRDVYKAFFKEGFKKAMELTEGSIFDKIRQWGNDRNFYGEGGATIQSQFVKIAEEMGELAGNIARGKDCTDDIGDMSVVLTHIAELAGTTIEKCIEHSYNEIKDRKGRFVNGSFIKESDLSETERGAGGYGSTGK